MNSRQLLNAIQHTNASIQHNQRKFKKAQHAIMEAIIPPEPYVYMMPIVAFFISMRYAEPLSRLFSISSIYRYGLLLMPLLKE